MIVAATQHDVQSFLKKQTGKSIGLVPTMGCLHAGHLSLVERSQAENDLTLVSIFVNPTQFSNPEDLQNYPRTLEQDQNMLRQAGVDLLFCPQPEVMYPPGTATQVVVQGTALPLEGAYRPGHFAGVATVVSKLFHILQPNRAYFGNKDYQQVKVIEQFTRDLNFPVSIVPCETQREADGLALSSRNLRLNTAQRQACPVLHRSLQFALERLQAGETDLEGLRLEMEVMILEAGLARIDYIAFNHAITLAPATEAQAPLLVSLAVFYGPVRLIDNLVWQG